MRKQIATACVTIAGLIGAAIALPGMANADAGDAQQAAADIAAVIDETGGADAVPTGVSVDIPSDPANGIGITANGFAVDIGLPGAAVADDAVTVRGTTIYTDALPATSIAAQPADGGIQALIVLESAAAPTQFPFPLTLPTGTTLAQLSDGSIVAAAPDGSLVGALAAPWATDANGTSVPTRFQISGNTVTQIVDHNAGTYAYPIVADPWWNPFSWNWSKVGKALVKGLTDCLGGAAKTTLGVGAGVVSANIAAKVVTGKLMVQMAGGPWGYFAVGAAGCIDGIIR